MAARTVLYIGNFEPAHSTENEIRKALHSLGHDVVTVQEGRVPYADVPAIALSAQPDFVLWTHTHGLGPPATHWEQAAMLGTLAARGIPTVAYHLDRWWGLERQAQTNEPFFQCEFVCTADGGHDTEWEQIGVEHIWMPPAISHEELGRGTRTARYESEIAFVGSWQGYGHTAWTWRPQMIAWLQETYGNRIRFWPEPGQHAIRGPALRDLYASVDVVVGDSCLVGDATRYWSDRIPETIGRGGLLIHPNVEGLRDADNFPLGPVSDEDVDGEFDQALPITFDVGDFEMLKFLIDDALSWPVATRRQVTDNGIRWVAERHTYQARMIDLLSILDEGVL
jgi:hypothetical protein